VESTFSIGLKGSEPDRAGALEKLVIEALAGIAAEPFPPSEVAAAFQQTSYAYREINSGHPLHVLDRVLSGALYGVDPLAFCRLGDHLDSLRQRYAAEPALFNRLVRERLLDNPHRLLTTLQPDADWQRRTDAAVAERLAKIRAGLADQQLEEIAGRAETLDRQAGLPNTPSRLPPCPSSASGPACAARAYPDHDHGAPRRRAPARQ